MRPVIKTPAVIDASAFRWLLTLLICRLNRQERGYPSIQKWDNTGVGNTTRRDESACAARYAT